MTLLLRVHKGVRGGNKGEVLQRKEEVGRKVYTVVEGRHWRGRGDNDWRERERERGGKEAVKSSRKDEKGVREERRGEEGERGGGLMAAHVGRKVTMTEGRWREKQGMGGRARREGRRTRGREEENKRG